MEAFVDKIKQYPAKEQADMKVKIKMPGSWFKNLTPAERRADYEVMAVDWDPNHTFPRMGERPSMPRLPFSAITSAS